MSWQAFAVNVARGRNCIPSTQSQDEAGTRWHRRKDRFQVRISRGDGNYSGETPGNARWCLVR
ncbi:hypothetical protein PLEOSDRAFT_1089558 [Pleurotus ostreatus PC15]|uniref:Uncharacterized protein n=1 Tax=Pleurotus ostreatus (strain PC15) TaxID=1137138 RepID=A0A067NWI6_PLEO1|nr:hypothetical protein PLEOSDRAFT_1089558 [Pleurotus ostreatus PC15]